MPKDKAGGSTAVPKVYKAKKIAVHTDIKT